MHNLLVVMVKYVGFPKKIKTRLIIKILKQNKSTSALQKF